MLLSVDLSRFKAAEIANDFKKAFDEAKDGKGSALDLPPTPVKVRERNDSSCRDSTRERKDSAKERKDSAKERERRQSASKSETPDRPKPLPSAEPFSFKPQISAASITSTPSPKVSFSLGNVGRFSTLASSAKNPTHNHHFSRCAVLHLLFHFCSQIPK